MAIIVMFRLRPIDHRPVRIGFGLNLDLVWKLFCGKQQTEVLRGDLAIKLQLCLGSN